MNASRKDLATARRIVVKVGSYLLSHESGGLNTERIADWSKQVATLQQQGCHVAIVSSGAVAEGMRRMKMKTRPQSRHEMQAAAAAGQIGLAHAYETAFSKYKICAAQILLTHADFNNRTRYLNARATLQTLFSLGAVPIVNENDTVATEEIQLGDNDTLASLVVNLVDADLLLILTDRDGLYDKDPATNPDAVLIAEEDATAPRLDKAAGPSDKMVGRGGMITKVAAARRAALSGTSTVIASGYESQSILRAVAGESVGTWLRAATRPLAARKKWIAGIKPAGTLTLDRGAVNAIAHDGKSLLPVGVRAVSGTFQRGDSVACADDDGRVIAYGLVNYSADEVRLVAGKQGKETRELLGSNFLEEVIHRDNLTIVGQAKD